MSQYQSIKVFLASPGDLADERRMFPGLLDHINEIKAHSLNCHFEAAGWQDALPGFGRPQEIINADVRDCDIFLMLLWKRWGSPSGAFTSGTEEELSIAQGRFECSGAPHLLLYFRSVPESMMADPGPQLEQVIRFRVQIEEKRICLYSTYDETPRWGDLLTKHLCRWLDRQTIGAEQAHPGEETSVVIPSEIKQELLDLQKRLEDASAQLESSQEKLRREAVKYGTDALEQVRQGKLTLAEELFAKSPRTLRGTSSHCKLCNILM